MATDLGISANVTMLFAFPRNDGKWTRQTGNVQFVDGHFHKIVVPGLDTRSGGDFGLTATFNLIQNAVSGVIMRGDIAKFVVQNGRLISADVVVKNVEIVD